MSRKTRGNIFLFITAFIWGSAFVAQRTGMEHIGPFTFSAVRFLIASLTLLPVIFVFSPKQNSSVSKTPGESKSLLKGGIICGVILFVGAMLQQIGLQYTTAGKTGFITALYVVLVPIMGSLFFHKKVSKLIWFCAFLAALGLYFLCIPAHGFSIAKGDTFVFICAFAFAIHILVIDYFSPKVDGIKMSAIQFLTAGIFSTFFMFLLENPDIKSILASAIPILYAAVLSAGIGFTLQIIAQKDTDPTVASLILCLESVFAVLAGAIILSETMSLREIIGCVIMFVAITLAQMPTKETIKKAV